MTRTDFSLARFFAAALASVASFAAPAFAQTIGSTVAVVPAAEGTLGAATRQLALGDGVSQNERIRTTPIGSARLKFRDDTTLTMGPGASVTLDRFVYNPDSTASASVLTATRGAFRFATGKSDKSAYQIVTPVATIGVRGTVLDFAVEGNRLRIRSVFGEAIVCRGGQQGAGSAAAGQRSCRTINPASGEMHVTLKAFSSVAGDLIGQLDDVHRRLNVAAGLPLADPVGGDTPAGGSFAGGGLPADPLAPAGGFEPPVVALVAGPALGAPPAEGFATAPNDPFVRYNWRFFPGYSVPSSFNVIGAGGVAPYAAIFGSPVVRNLPSLERDLADPAAVKLFEPFGNPAIMLGRWADGNLKINDPASASPILPISEDQGVHYIVGRLTQPSEFGLPSFAASPSMDLNYNLAHATKPTEQGGSGIPAGTFTGAMVVRVTATLAYIGFTGTATFPAPVIFGPSLFLARPPAASPPAFLSYTLQTAGGLANPSLSPITVALPATNNEVLIPAGPVEVSRSGAPCPTCSGQIVGHFYGSSHQFAGIFYDVSDDPFQFTGAAAFERAAGPAAGSGDTILSPRQMTVQGIGNLSQLIENADLMWLDPTGNLYKAGKTGGVTLDRVTAKQVEKGSFGPANNPVISFERWTDGFVAGSLASHFQPNTGVHIVSGQPATALPTSGTFSYNLVGATSPTIRDGSLAPGIFSGAMAVQFGANTKVGVDFNVGIGGHNYNVKSNGGVAAPGSSPINLSPSGTFAVSALPVTPGGPACASAPCSANVNGFLAGPGGMFAGVGYAIGSAAGNGAKVVSGGAVFKR